MIVCSLNEVETYGRRAARGAGMSWGLAEEAGKAARWLAEHGLPGVELLVRLLTINDGRSYSNMAPEVRDNRWQASAGDLCPVCCGAALCDRAELLAHGSAIHFNDLACPLLLAPFVDCSRSVDGGSCEMRWPNVRLLLSGDGVMLECAKPSAHLSERAEEVRVSLRLSHTVQPTHLPRTEGIETAASAWRALEALAKRTYVPATDESRARGAGAGRTDND